jgi:3-oxoacyl-[acyl-carrier-protein] synthase-1
MEKALKKAKLQPANIDYINAHGSGTINNDLAEGKAVKRLFTSSVDISSTKGYYGHTLAATGAMEAITSVMAIKHQTLPPNLGFNKCDPQIGLEPLTIPAQKRIDAVLSNSLGFGGNNCSLVITKKET